MNKDNNINNSTDPKKDEPLKDELEAPETAEQETDLDELQDDDDDSSDEGGFSQVPTGKSKKKGSSVTSKRSFRFGSMATAFTAIFVVIVILINVGLTLLSSRYGLSLDLTNSKDYGLSSATINFVSKIKKDITIKVLATQPSFEAAEHYAAPAKIIENYPVANHNIHIEWLDLTKNPGLTQEYKGESLSGGDVIVSTTGTDGKEIYKHIASSDLLVLSTDSSSNPTVDGNKAEQQIDTALSYVTSTVHPTVTFTSGHNEDSASAYQSFLKNNGYTVSAVNTVSSKISSSAASIAIVDPQVDFSAGEIKKIDSFLRNGGKYGKNIFIFLDPRYNTPKLNAYIAEWGVSVGKGYIYDSLSSYDGNPYEAISTDFDSDVVGSNVSSNVGMNVAYARPLTVQFSTKGYRTAKSIVKTGDTSQLLYLKNNKTTDSGKVGPFTTMTLSTWSASSNTYSAKSNMVVSGSFDILNSVLLNTSTYNNGNVMLGINNTVMSKKSTITVSEKDSASTSLSLSNAQSTAIMIIFVIAIPLIILAIGLIVWLRRRHL